MYLLFILIFNWISGLLLFKTGEKLSEVQKVRRLFLFVPAFLLALPGFLFLPQYSHLLDNAKWFYEYRTLWFSDFLFGGTGFLFGLVSGLFCKKIIFLRAVLRSAMIIVVFMPFLKSVLTPLNKNNLQDKWSVDGVCFQSSGSTCGPASAATIMKNFGVAVTEKDIAAEALTSASGTEIWYIARAFKKRGFTIEFIIIDTANIDISNIPCPSIAGTRIGGIGHFVPILKKTPAGYITADPLIGKREIPYSGMIEKSGLNGFFMKISR